MHPVVATTPTQYAFALCFFVVSPLLALYAAVITRNRDGNPWGAILAVGGATWGVWVISGAVAAMLFPGVAGPRGRLGGHAE